MAQEVTTKVAQGPMGGYGEYVEPAREMPPAEDWNVEFKDLNQKDQIERLRKTVSNQQDTIDRLFGRLDALEVHQHAENGAILVSLHHNRLVGGGTRGGWL